MNEGIIALVLLAVLVVGLGLVGEHSNMNKKKHASH